MARLTFGGLDLSPFAPGFDSEIARRWGVHTIPGQRGALQEDLGDGTLETTVQLAFVKVDDYNKVLDALDKKPRADLVHPRRGTRRSVVRRIREAVKWTQQGEEVTVVTLTFADAALSEPDQFRGG